MRLVPSYWTHLSESSENNQSTDLFSIRGPWRPYLTIIFQICQVEFIQTQHMNVSPGVFYAQLSQSLNETRLPHRIIFQPWFGWGKKWAATHWRFISYLSRPEDGDGAGTSQGH